jgi:hypothetical protein
MSVFTIEFRSDNPCQSFSCNAHCCHYGIAPRVNVLRPGTPDPVLAISVEEFNHKDQHLAHNSAVLFLSEAQARQLVSDLLASLNAAHAADSQKGAQP